MVAKILPSTATFNAVGYNSKRINNGDGELMAIENFPTLSMNKVPSQEIVKDYLKAYSKTNKRVKEPQFHTMISAKGKEYDKYQITEVAKLYMDKMGYGNQPYVIIYHNNTENNHVHIVSTRVTKEGKKINDSFEKVRSMKAMQEIMNEKYNISEIKKLEKLLSYKYAGHPQLKTLLERNSFKISQKDEKYNVYKGGVFIKSLDKLSPVDLDKKEKATLKAKLISYSNTYDASLRFQKDKGVWTSQAVEKLKESLGIDIVFHHKGEKQPFGYTIIDNTNSSVVKGSDILKLGQFINPENTIVETVSPQVEEEQPRAISEEIRTATTTEQENTIHPEISFEVSVHEEEQGTTIDREQEQFVNTSTASSALADFLRAINEDEEQGEEEEQDNKNKLRKFRRR